MRRRPLGEKLRSGEERTEEALARAGRFKMVRDNLEVKEIVIGNGEKRSKDGRALQRTETTSEQAKAFKTLKMPHPAAGNPRL